MSIVEVARHAGLSHSTVSRVINGRPGVSPENIEAVHRAMQQLGYTPSARRPGPKPRDRSGVINGTIGLLMIGSDAMFARAPVTAAVFHGAEQALTERGFNLIFGQLGPEGRLPPQVSSGQIDGLLLHGYAPPAKVRSLLMNRPSVWMLSQRSSRGYWGDRVGPDNELIGRIAAEHLVARGHTQVAYLYFSATHMGFRSRSEAFCETAEELGARTALVGDDSIRSRPFPKEDFGMEQTDEVVDRLLALTPRPTGVFVPRDRLTVKLYKALRERGIEPGRDIEILSCDNEPILEALDPRPATIDVRPSLIGARAVEQLLWRVNHPAEHTRSTITVEPRLVLPDFMGPITNGPGGDHAAAARPHSSTRDNRPNEDARTAS
jgi:LacI family transcriptional regulator